MEKRIFVSILMLFWALSLTAQLSQSIKGQVLDKQSQAPLIGVNVVVQLSDEFKGSASDVDGYFKIEDIPVGRHSLVFSYLGYEDVVISNLLLNSAKELVLKIEMTEEINVLNEVVVEADQGKNRVNNDMATASVRTLSVEEMARFSGTIADPARMAQNYAGVSGASDDRNDIIIRGNSPTGVIWRMEGVDIPSPNHFATIGTTGGPVSMLNLNNLRNSDFITSAFPAEYGNGSSGVFDLKLRNGNQDRYEFIGQIGFNGFEAGIEGPLKIGKRSSIMANYRHSTLEVFDLLGFDLGVGNAVPQYKDLTFKINMPTEKMGRFSIWGVGGLSFIEFLPDPDGDNTNLFADDDEETIVTSNTGFGGLSHVYFFNDNTSSKLDFVVSGNENDVTTDTLSEDDQKSRIFSRDFSTSRYSVNWKLNKKINARNQISAGFIFDHHRFNFMDSVLFDNDIYDQAVSYDGTLNLLREYIQWQHRFNDQLKVNTGVHFMQLGFNNSFAVDPRLGLQYELNEANTFNMGFGIHSQMQPLSIYFQSRLDNSGESFLPNENLDFFKSFHSVIGWDHFFSSKLRIKLETYFQYLYDVAVDIEDSNFSMINSGADFGFPDRVGLDNDGTGTNYGVEFTLEKFFDKQYYFLVTCSLFDSKYKGSNGVEHNTLFNSNYVLNALGGKEFQLNDKFTLTLDSKLTFSGGRRHTPVNEAQSLLEQDEVFFEDRSFELQHDPYFRADLKVGIRHNAKKFSQSFSVDLQNITNRDNIFIREFDAGSGAYETTYQRGFFPDVRYQIWF